MSPPASIDAAELDLLDALRISATATSSFRLRRSSLRAAAADMLGTIRRRPSLFRSRRLKLVRNCPLPRPGADGDDQYYLPDDLEERWNDALIRAPDHCGVSEINLSQALELRWEQAWLRSPVC